MSLFLSTYVNKVDKKGRVSVPSHFRSAVAGESFSGIVAYKSVINDCIEGCSMSRIEKISNSIDSLDVLSEARDAFATAILGSSIQLSFDNEGRVIFPREIMQEVGILDSAIFVGKGQTFEVWDPCKFASHLKESKRIAMVNRHLLQFK